MSHSAGMSSMRTIAMTGLVIGVPLSAMHYNVTNKLPWLQFAWMAACVVMIASTLRASKR